MLAQSTRTSISQNEYRLVWINRDADNDDVHYGTFLFNTPEEARPAINLMKTLFPRYIIWMEDRDNNNIPISI